MPAEENIPFLGVGLGYRPQFHEYIMTRRDEIDWLEIITDRYIDDSAALDELLMLTELYTVVPHGLEMSIGSDGPLDMDYLAAVADVAKAVDAPWVSDHLCFTHQDGLDLDSLTPVHRTRARAREIAAKAQQVQETLGRPFLLENIAYYVDIPGECGEAEFIGEVMDHCDCGILLDLNNVAVNARNHDFDAKTFIDLLPLPRVQQVHIAGSMREPRADQLQIDSHDDRVSDEVFSLLEYLWTKQSFKAVLLERDDNFPSGFQEIVDDLSRARSLLGSAGPV